MGWRLANATGRWLLSATTGLWKLCTCCTGGCANVYLVYSCKPNSIEDPCRFGEEEFYICEDQEFDDGEGGTRTIAEIFADGDVLSSLSEGCYYLSGSVAYADIPEGVSEFPYISDTTAPTGVGCDDEACAPNYAGACSCVCYTNDAEGDVVCCYGEKSELPVDPRWTITLAASYQVDVENTFYAGTASVPCPDDCLAGTDCTLIRDECRTYGPEKSGDLGVPCTAVKDTEFRTVTSKDCCTGTNSPVDWTDSGNTGADLSGFSNGGLIVSAPCGYSCFGGQGNVSGETIYSTIGSCVNKITWSNTRTESCTSVHQVCYAEEWTAYPRFDDETACHCQRVQKTTVEWEFTLTPITPQTPDELRLCAMCEQYQASV